MWKKIAGDNDFNLTYPLCGLKIKKDLSTVILKRKEIIYGEQNFKALSNTIRLKR